MFVRRSDRQKWGLSGGQLPLPTPTVQPTSPPPDTCFQPGFPLPTLSCPVSLGLFCPSQHTGLSVWKPLVLSHTPLWISLIQQPVSYPCLTNVLMAVQQWQTVMNSSAVWKPALPCLIAVICEIRMCFSFFFTLLLWLHACSNQFAYKCFHSAAKAVTQKKTM